MHLDIMKTILNKLNFISENKFYEIKLHSYKYTMLPFNSIILLILYIPNILSTNDLDCSNTDLLINSMYPLIIDLINLQDNNTNNIDTLHSIAMFQDIIHQHYIQCNYTNSLSCNDSKSYLVELNSKQINYRYNNIKTITKLLIHNIFSIDNYLCNKTNNSIDDLCQYIRYDLLFKSRHIFIKQNKLISSYNKLFYDIYLFIKFIHDLVKYYSQCKPISTIFTCNSNLYQINKYEWETTTNTNNITKN